MTWRHASLCLTLALFACARGASESGNAIDAIGDGNGGGSADSGEGGADAMTSPVRDAGAKDAGMKPLPKDAGTPGKDAGPKDAGMEPAASCMLMNMCSSARVIPQLAGDTGSETRMVTGTSGEWLSVLVSDTTLTGSRLKARISLTSNDGANYDLFVLKPADTGGAVEAPSDCSVTPAVSANVSGADTVSSAWADISPNLPGQSAGDGLILSIEVRHVSGPCGSWSLTVEGNK